MVDTELTVADGMKVDLDLTLRLDDEQIVATSEGQEPLVFFQGHSAPGIYARAFLEGRITERGVIAPVNPDVYNPILDELKNLGIVCVERVGE